MNHTPGPWRQEAIPASAHTDPDLRVHEDARFWILSEGDAGEVLALVEVRPRCEAEALANAHVIAAAPGMLQALREVVGAHAEAGNCYYCLADAGAPHEDDCTMLFVLEAIEKAEGV